MSVCIVESISEPFMCISIGNDPRPDSCVILLVNSRYQIDPLPTNSLNSDRNKVSSTAG